LEKVPELFSPVIQENLLIRLEFLVRIGLEPITLGKTIAQRPGMLDFNLEGMTRSYNPYKYIEPFLKGDDVAKITTWFAEVLVMDRKRKSKPIVDYLLKLGVKPGQLGKVLLRKPQLLGYRITALEARIEYLRELGVKEEALGKVIARAPQVICLNHEEKLKPVIKFLRSAGLNQDKDIEMMLSRNAQILCCDIEKNLRPKFEFFYTVGLSKRQVARIAVLFPSMFGLSIEGSLKPKYNYLVHVMKRSIEEIVDFPQYFGCSLEKRIKPRNEQLARRGIHASLPSMLVCKDKDFDSRYLHGNNHELSDNHNDEC
jgi:mTERF domain-containing protein